MFPTNKVAIKDDGSRENFDKTLAAKLPLFFSISIFSLLEETKASSRPENKPENTIDNMKIVQLPIIKLNRKPTPVDFRQFQPR